ncbi:TonB-dependent receptor [Aquimarina agarivorans]|uniref:TonB-dependent receptor n=1 Tax=Aquimarina agarivorans TaxID=980584 RepID=UPI000248E7A8|nr:carboxypeptidase-like regulatory domain-containing protein [Aquimarina agarivorans]
MKTTLFLFLSLFTLSLYAQTAEVKGIVLDEFNNPVTGAEVVSDINTGTQTDGNGVYLLNIPANKQINITITYTGFKKVAFQIQLKPNQQYEFNPVLKTDVEQISEVVITGTSRKDVEGIVNLDPKTIRNTPSANAGVEGLLKTLPGVSNNNELSTQYNVRGGNFDENLVYVNEIEVYRPFLIRSGQQEGLSFVNTDLVSNVDFSAGGFQAKYGDKLSSVLDVTYKTPKKLGARAELSLLGGSLALQGISKDANTTAMLGIRYRDNSLLVDARDTDSNFRPRFGDIQTYVTHNFSSKFALSFLGNVAINLYDLEPISRRTNFGTLDSPRALTVVYDGQESDRYQTLFGAFKGTYKPTKDLSLRFIASGYHTQEQEYFDFLAQYRVGKVNAAIGSDSFGEIESVEGIGAQISHARNDLDALIFNFEHRGTYTKNDNQFDWGLKYTNENVRDRVREYEFVDNSGFFVPSPFIEQQIDPTPDDPLDGDPRDSRTDPRIIPFSNVNAQNEITIHRISDYVQWSKKTFIGDHKAWINAGVRSQLWQIADNNGNAISDRQITISPRAQFTLKPNWEKDMLFRFSTGLYHQPPFYRELRNQLGAVVPNVNAQQSFHVSLSNDYSFKMWDRAFKLTSEIYYKKLSDVNTYTLENVRIRYRANNNAEAFAQGLDLRINGEFVPGTESWFSFGYLRTEENLDNRGFIPRPTDQRLKFGVLFQDYVKSIPNLKMYLNLVYQTGLPGGSPSFADPYEFQSRLNDYRRVDIGTSYVIVDGENKKAKTFKFLNNFETFEIGVEVFNLFNLQNSITNTFVRDANSLRQFAVPNFLTPRILNVKLRMSL